VEGSPHTGHTVAGMRFTVEPQIWQMNTWSVFSSMRRATVPKKLGEYLRILSMMSRCCLWDSQA